MDIALIYMKILVTIYGHGGWRDIFNPSKKIFRGQKNCISSTDKFFFLQKIFLQPKKRRCTACTSITASERCRCDTDTTKYFTFTRRSACITRLLLLNFVFKFCKEFLSIFHLPKRMIGFTNIHLILYNHYLALSFINWSLCFFHDQRYNHSIDVASTMHLNIKLFWLKVANALPALIKLLMMWTTCWAFLFHHYYFCCCLWHKS